jgi:hypothetical protein
MKATAGKGKAASQGSGFCLNRAQITAADDIQMEKVFVPEWANGDKTAYVMVKSMTAREKGLFDQSMVTEESRGTQKPVMDTTDYGPKMAILSMCDDRGKRLFELKDIDILAGKSALALDRVVKKAMELNGVTAEALKAAEKN